MRINDLSDLDDLLMVAQRMGWFKPPLEALADHRLFLTHVMTYGIDQDVTVARKYFTDDQFREVLVHPLPGIFDAHSWYHWHVVLGIDPLPPLPRRFG